MKEIIYTKHAPEPIGPYSQAIRYNELLYISGQTGVDMSTGRLCGGSVGEQARYALKSISEIAKASGTDIKNAVRATVLLTDMNDFAEVNAVYAEFFPEAQPARACFAVAALPLAARVEIEVICAM